MNDWELNQNYASVMGATRAMHVRNWCYAINARPSNISAKNASKETGPVTESGVSSAQTWVVIDRMTPWDWDVAGTLKPATDQMGARTLDHLGCKEISKEPA